MAIVTYFTDRQSGTITPLDITERLKETIVMSAPDTAPASADVIELIDIPADMYIKDGYVNVTKVEGATCTATVGDGVDPNGYILSLDLDTLGVTKFDGAHSGMTDYVLAEPHVGAVAYSAVDTLDMTLSNNCSTAEFDIVIIFDYIRDTSE